MIFGYEERTVIGAGVAAVCAIVLFVIWLLRADKRAEARAKREAFRRAEVSAFDAVPVAYLTETMTWTTGGGLSAVVMIMVNFGFVALFLFGGTRNAIQETVFALIWIALNSGLGIAVLVGRSRTLVMRRPEEPQQAEGLDRRGHL